MKCGAEHCLNHAVVYQVDYRREEETLLCEQCAKLPYAFCVGSRTLNRCINSCNTYHYLVPDSKYQFPVGTVRIIIEGDK